MADELVIAGRYGNTAEAHAARLALDAAGIEAFVGDDAAADMLSIMATGLGGVKLLVPRSQLERARRILERDRSHKKPAVPAWICQQCGSVVDAGFEVCWSCGAEYDADRSRHAPPDADEQAEDEYFESPSPPEPDDEQGAVEHEPLQEGEWRCPGCGLRIDAAYTECPACGAHPGAEPNPYIAHEAEVETDHADHAPGHLHPPDDVAAMLDRAWYSAVLGVVLCPGVLHLYSLWLLMRVAMSGYELTPKANRRFYFALAIDVLFPVLLFLSWHAFVYAYR